MKKSIYVIIISVITTVSIVAGVCIHVLGKGLFNLFDRSGSAMKEGSVEISEELTRLDIDIDAADIRIKYGDKAAVEYYLAESMVPDIYVETGTLCIKEKKNSGWRVNPFQMKDSYILIVIPEEMTLDKITLDCDAGDIDITSVKTDKLEADVDAGNIKINDVSAKDVRFDVDAGNLEFTGCGFGDLSMEVDAGNVDITDCTVDEITADLDAGNIESHNSKITSGRANVDFGNIELHGDIGDVKTKVSLGNVEKDN